MKIRACKGLNLIVAACVSSWLILAAPMWCGADSLDEANALSDKASELYKAGMYQEAVSLAQQALSIREKVLGVEHTDLTLSINNLAFLYYTIGSYDKALPLYERALKNCEKVLGPDHTDTATILNSLAMLYQAMGSYDKALPLYERALKIREKVLGPEHYDTAISLNNLASLYQSKGLYDKALPLCERGLKIFQKVLGLEHPHTATSLNNIALLYQAMGSYDKALPLYERALKIREKVLGPEHIDTALSLNNLAFLYEKTGPYDKALPLLERALKIFEKVLGPDHDRTALCLSNLAGLYEKMGSYDKALPLYERALKIREKVLGPEHDDTALSLNNLAFLYEKTGSYDKALPLYERALKIFEKTLGPEHDKTAQSLNNLAGIYWKMGSDDKALPIYERALKIREKVLGPDHIDTAETLNNLAFHYKNTGSYYKALPLYERALKIFEKALGPEHDKTALSLNNLANLYSTIGSYDKALPHYERALEIKEKVFGPEHADTALSLNNLAFYYKTTGSYDKALPLYERALYIFEKALGPEHDRTASSLNHLAGLYEAMGSYDKALPFCERALKIREKVLGLEHDDTALSLQSLGSLFLAMKDYINAEFYIRKSKSQFSLVDFYLETGEHIEALKILHKYPLDGRNTITYQIEFNTKSGIALSATGRRPEAAKKLLNAVQGIEDLRTRVAGEKQGFFQAGSTGGYVRTYRSLVSTLAESSLQGEKLPADFSVYGDSPAEAGFYFSEATKARTLLEAMAKSAIKKMKVEIPEDLRREEENLTNQLSALSDQWERAFKAGSAVALEEVKTKKDNLNGKLDILIGDFRKNYPAYAALHYPRPVPAKELPLTTQEILLEYALGEKTSAIFLVRKGGVEKVISIPMGKVALEEKVKAFMDPFLNRQGAGFSTTAAKELYDLLLADAFVDIQETDHVVIIPDGILGLLPFEALIDKEGKGVNDSSYIGDRYSIGYYQSATIMALQRTLKQQSATKALFALGNPVFSADDTRYTTFRSGQKSNAVIANKGGTAFRALATHKDWGATSRSGDSGKDLVYPSLPETEGEVRSIAKLFDVKVGPPDILLNLDASAKKLEEVTLKNYRYVHFATHADLPGNVQGVNEPFILLGQVDNAKEEDGFLTMSKVLGLSLNADMVVLSACLTGRGKVMEGEGVANFARAFQHAGARSVLVSLWEVSSDETVEYMEKFYGYLKAGQTRSAALRMTRNEIKSRYPNPFIWAPFILHGEG